MGFGVLGNQNPGSRIQTQKAGEFYYEGFIYLPTRLSGQGAKPRNQDKREYHIELEHYIQNQKIPVSKPVCAQTGFGTQNHYEAPGDL